MKRKQDEIKKNIEKFKETVENNRRLPKLEKKNIIKKCLSNFVILFILLIYLLCLLIGENNMQTESYSVTLKILSIILILLTIILFEIAYKTDKNALILHSIELLVFTFFTLFLVSAYSLYYGNFYKVIILGMIISITYYVLKCIIILIHSINKYHKSLNDIQTIVAK